MPENKLKNHAKTGKTGLQRSKIHFRFPVIEEEDYHILSYRIISTIY